MKRWLLVGLMMLGASAAQAKCALPRLQLLWSYPSEGAVDVPTNAELWFLVPYAWDSPVVRLDGQDLAYTAAAGARGVVHVLPGALLPDHDYLLQLDFSKVREGEDAGANTLVEIPFRTGATQAVRPAAPRLGGYRAVAPRLFADELASTCPDVLRAQDCLDVGPNTVHRWDGEGEAPLAWLVEEHLLPPPCSQPEVLALAPASGCVHVRAVGAGGLAGEAREVCYAAMLRDAKPDAGTAPSERSDFVSETSVPNTHADGCNVGNAGQGGLALLLLALAKLRGSGRAALRGRASG